MTYITQGIHDIPIADYIADPCPEPSLSKGTIALLHKRSPIHAWKAHPRFGGQSSDSYRADIGSAAHAVLLGGDERIVYCDAEYKSGPRKGQTVADWTAKAAQEFQNAAWKEGLIPVLLGDQQRIELMSKIASTAIRAKSTELTTSLESDDGDTEQTLIWKDDGVWCRARPDWLSKNRDLVIEYKTTTNADPHAWTRRTLIAGYYDIQAAHVLRGLDVLFGEKQRTYLLLVQEIDDPYASSWVGVSPELEEHARTEKIMKVLPIWRRCIETDQWPGYSQEVYWADVQTGDAWDSEARGLRLKGV